MKYIITESQYKTILEQRSKRTKDEIYREKIERDEMLLAYDKKTSSKKREIQSYINDVIIPEHNNDSEIKILKCDITNLMFSMYQHDIYVYFDIEYTTDSPTYKEQLERGLYYIKEPWRNLSGFFYILKDKLDERYNWDNKQRIGFNPHSCEYNLV